jgi:electron-transferring-flavoprotein dehydrogenase
VKSARSVLIAGAGDLGGRLATLRAGRGDDVIALRRRDVALAPGIRGLRVDLATGEGFSRLPQRPDVLVFCAAPDQRDESAYRALYVDGLRRLLDALEISRLVFVSSTAVYAQDAGEWVDEQSPALAEQFNGRVLLDAERELAAHAAGIVLRLSGIYGPGREMMLRRARDGGTGRARWSNRIHVDDAASALSHLIDAQHPEWLYLGNDDLPALESEVLAWLREREGLPRSALETSTESGRRVCNARLRASGWTPAYPDFRAGYAETSPR